MMIGSRDSSYTERTGTIEIELVAKNSFFSIVWLFLQKWPMARKSVDSRRSLAEKKGGSLTTFKFWRFWAFLRKFVEFQRGISQKKLCARRFL